MAHHITKSFNFPTTQAEMIDKAVRLAQIEGKSFSNLITELLKEYVQKNAERARNDNNPLGILYQESKIKTLDVFFTALTGLDEWLERDTMLSSDDASRIEGRAMVLQRKAKQRYLELKNKERFGSR
jgi:succinyl-CoA synthetase beta subunit